MEETVKQGNTTANTEEQGNTENITFSKADVDAMIETRLARERSKYADYDAMKEKAEKYDKMEEANKSELQKAIERGDALQSELDSIKAANTIRDIRTKVAEETGVPASLLTAATEDECREQAKAILDYANPKGYPSVRDGGEVTHTGKATTRQQFAEWANQAFG